MPAGLSVANTHKVAARWKNSTARIFIVLTLTISITYHPSTSSQSYLLLQHSLSMTRPKCSILRSLVIDSVDITKDFRWHTRSIRTKLPDLICSYSRFKYRCLPMRKSLSAIVSFNPLPVFWFKME